MTTEIFSPEESWFTLSIGDLLSHKQTYLNFLDFQREDAWSLYTKRRFIEGILCRYHVPEFQLVKIDDENFAYLDGKQRSLTIVDFAADGFTTFLMVQLTQISCVQNSR